MKIYVCQMLYLRVCIYNIKKKYATNRLFCSSNYIILWSELEMLVSLWTLWIRKLNKIIQIHCLQKTIPHHKKSNLGKTCNLEKRESLYFLNCNIFMHLKICFLESLFCLVLGALRRHSFTHDTIFLTKKVNCVKKYSFWGFHRSFFNVDLNMKIWKIILNNSFLLITKACSSHNQMFI